MRAKKIFIALSFVGLGVVLGAPRHSLVISAEEQIRTPQAMVGIVGNMVFLVHQVEPGSPAEQAGLRPGDLIKSINGRQVSSIEDMLQIAEGAPGQSLEIVYMRYNPTTSQPEGYRTTLKSVPWKTPKP
ncbi:MAG: PDZ domain-containing protein [bacterium JZ-2024 1]